MGARGPTSDAPCRVALSFEREHPEWDQFVASAAGTSYMQATAWARVKAAYGWDVARLLVLRDERIVAGAQMLIRRLPFAGAIGWAVRAPLVTPADDEATELVIDGLLDLGRRLGLTVLMVQPPLADGALLSGLTRRGFRTSPLGMAPTSTIRFDLRSDLGVLQAGMRKKTRQHLRRGLRSGVTVREVGEEHLATFYRLHLDTSRRQAFPPYPEKYFPLLWSAFSPQGAIRLFLAEHEGETLSGLMCIASGDTLFAMAMAWSGRQAKVMPNEVLYWCVIEWAKEHAYRVCDLTWIDSETAAAVLDGRPLPEDARHSATFFKLGFGGRITHLPGAYGYVFIPALRPAYRLGMLVLARSSRLHHALLKLRWRWPTRAAAGDAARRDGR